MSMLNVLSEIVFTIGLTLGVGSSTFALIFYIQSLKDGTIEPIERRFLKTVFIVLRIGMILIGAGIVLIFLTSGVLLVPELVLLSIITLNALLMAYHRMPMQFGPVIAGGSWYSLFLYAKTPLGEIPNVYLLPIYGFVLLCVYSVFRFCIHRFTPGVRTFRGEVAADTETCTKYSTDASSFKVTPQAIYYPKNTQDIVSLISLCKKEHTTNPHASLTIRAGGTCMSGGPLNTGWIIDMTKHMNTVSIDPKNRTATVEMGAYFRDIEDAAKKHNLLFPAYTSSHRLCGIGGMLGNNASGEKSLRCGATSDNVLELEIVLADGSVERVVPKPLDRIETDREKKLVELHKKYGDKLKIARGNVKKSASGYRIEKIVEDTTFNAIPLFVGAQGTLGIITRAVLRLVPIPQHTELLLIPLSSLKEISGVIAIINNHNPEGLETFDQNTFSKAEEHLAQYAKIAKPYIAPKSHLVILAQFSEATQEATLERARACLDELATAGVHAEHVTNPEHAAALWEIRRHSFLLMRDYNPDGFRAVPCIEDVIVPLSALSPFITGLRTILKKHGVMYGYHGHIGDGSLRIIPVFDFTKATVHEDITNLMRDVFTLIKKLKGNISADHSDGIIRSPFLREFYGDELYESFEQVKQLFDPENIMNPNKKVGGTLELLAASLDRKKE